MNRNSAILTLLFFMGACNPRGDRLKFSETAGSPDSGKYNFIVSPDLETSPVRAGLDDDSADDPAVFSLPSSSNSTIIAGSNKVAGIHFYDLNGKEISFSDCGMINNVDSRNLFDYKGEEWVLLGGSNRSGNSIILVIISDCDNLIPDTILNFKSGLDDVYGFCLYLSKKGECFAFVNSKTGEIEQWHIRHNEEGINAVVVRRLAVPSQPEGMVADDRTGKLFVGEEGNGIHVFEADPEKSDRHFIIPFSDSLNPEIKYDIEGLAIYKKGSKRGYLLASSQGNNSYAIFSLPDYKYLKSFSIIGDSIDSVEETDGIEIYDSFISDRFPMGIMVVQDGLNKTTDTIEPQNFKIIDWRKISSHLE